MTAPDRIAILGCGYVGLALGRTLQDSTVYGVRRSDSGLEAVRAAGLEPHRADLTDPADVADLPAADALIFAASPSRETSAREVYTGALGDVIDEYASRDHPPDRLIYTSSTGVYGDHDGDWVDEDTPIYPDTERQRVLLEAERLTLERAGAEGIDGTVVRFGGLYGPGRYRLERYLEGPVTEGYLNLTHREDAAGVCRFLLERDRHSNGVVLAVDGNPVEKWTFADWLAEECGVDAPPKQTVEQRLADEDPSDAARHRIAANKRCSNALLEELGYEFAVPTARDGYRPAIDAYLSGGDTREDAS